MRMDKCPHCGSNYGLYSKEHVTFEQYYGFDGEEDGYSEFHYINKRRSTPLYCMDCHKRVITHEQLLEEIDEP